MTRMTKPSEEQMDVAILWLEGYDGDGDSSEAACKAVAAWLKHFINKEQRDKLAKSLAKETGRSVADIRARLRQMEV